MRKEYCFKYVLLCEQVDTNQYNFFPVFIKNIIEGGDIKYDRSNIVLSSL